MVGGSDGPRFTDVVLFVECQLLCSVVDKHHVCC